MRSKTAALLAMLLVLMFMLTVSGCANVTDCKAPNSCSKIGNMADKAHPTETQNFQDLIKFNLEA